MPASTSDLIDAALFSAYSRKPSDEVDGTNTTIQNQHFPTAKQALLSCCKTSNPINKQQLNLGSGASIHVLQKKHGMLKADKKAALGSSDKSNMAQSKNDDKLEEPRTVLWPVENIVLGWRKNFPPGAGMVNLGNTCYMNSSLQALFHIPSLVNWLLEEASTHIPSCENNVQNASYCSICGMMRTLKQALDRDNNVIKPSHIHNKLKCIGKTLAYGRQEDAHEFIKMLLDHMEKSFLSFVRASKLDHRSKETTPLNQIFGGYLRQQVICPLCHYVSTTFSHFQDIVLDIRAVGSVEDALNLYFRKETLDTDNAYRCEKCHKKVPATKRHLIEKAPHVLLLQLKRFTIAGGKITKHVNIQKTIDLSKHVNGVRLAPTGGGSYVYRLVSMVIHIGGSQHGGHYTAVAEASNKTMFEFDDASVRPISMQSALLRNPYILFYEMVHRPKNVANVKQVMRQSSEKALLRQTSNDRLSKPLPTSLSTSCMSNGSSSSEVGESVNRNSYHQQKTKSPLVSHKERERVSFGLKNNSLSSKRDNCDSKSSGSSSSSSGYSSYQSSSSSVGKGSSKSRPHSGLVPYNSDSDSEEENKRVMNGHHLPKDNGHSNSKSLESKKTMQPKNGQSENGTKNRKPVNSDERIAGSYSAIKLNGKPVTSFLPRTLQVNLSKSTVKVNTNVVKHSELKETDCESTNCDSINNCSNSPASRPKRPELEKSLSHDSVLPPKSRSLDRASDTASLKSKDSLDSNRSDKSSRSVKRSFLSLLPCVSSNHSHSPDLSPENERMNSIVENPEAPTGSVESDCEGQFSKRNRDNDEHEPTSPSKKCRPEDRLRPLENGTSKASKSDIDEEKQTNSDTNGSRHSSAADKIVLKNNSLRDDENFSMEEKKSRHKKKKKRHPSVSDSDSSSSEGGETPAEDKRSRLNPSAIVVSWDQNLKDLGRRKDAKQIPALPELPNGNHYKNSVADELRKAGNFSFGIPVSTWDGAPSLLDRETQKARNEARKRSADEVFNDELDTGKLSKKKPRNRYEDYSSSQDGENPFQKYQSNLSSSKGSWEENGSAKYNDYSRSSFHKNSNSFHHRTKSWGSTRAFHPSNSNHYRSHSFGGSKPWHRKNNKDTYRNRDKFRFQRH